MSLDIDTRVDLEHGARVEITAGKHTGEVAYYYSENEIDNVTGKVMVTVRLSATDEEVEVPYEDVKAT